MINCDKRQIEKKNMCMMNNFVWIDLAIKSTLQIDMRVFVQKMPSGNAHITVKTNIL
jgi:hypothetical protein